MRPDALDGSVSAGKTGFQSWPTRSPEAGEALNPP
jgi:hypothetical protein